MDNQVWEEQAVIYSNYCKDAAKERFIFDIECLIEREKNYDPSSFEAIKHAYLVAGEMMKELKAGTSWETIAIIYNREVKTFLDMTLVGEFMLEYSEYGTTFVEVVLDFDNMNLIANLMKKYDSKKELEDLKKMGYK